MSLAPGAAWTLAAESLARHGFGGPPRPLQGTGAAAQAHLFEADGPEGPILVKVWHDPDRAMRQARRQRQVARAMQRGAFRVPAVLFFDSDLRALGMPKVAGESLATLWHAGRTEVPATAGHWLAAYHGLTRQAVRFDPTGQVNWLSRLIGATRDGQRDIPEPDGFIASAHAVQAMSQGVSGRPSVRAVTHRDMTLSNLMLAVDGACWGLDFENKREDEPLRDVFTLVLDLLSLGPRGGADAMADLRRSYGDDTSDPAVRLFLQRCFCLWVWANTPPVPSARQLRRLAVAEALLRAETAVI